MASRASGATIICASLRCTCSGWREAIRISRFSPPSMTRNVALVTGGTRGIGLGIAQALARDGWDLAICGLRDEAEVAAVLDTLRGGGVAVGYWQADVASPADRSRLLDEVSRRYGRLHALINNAGRAPRVRADLLEAGEASFDEIIRTNLQGPNF